MPSLEVLPDRRIAIFNGEEVPLGARAFDVLAFLFDNSDRVVSKEELLNQVWSGMMVEESNLTVQIAGLRKVLGRKSISTVPGVGYKLTLAEKKPEPRPPAKSETLPPVPNKPSLVVLPFANLTGEAAKDYLVDGMVHEIISALSRISAFFVISSTSSFTYKGRAVDLEEVGRELGVRYILEGSIQQAGSQMRISTQLVEAETGHTIWRDRFEGNANDIFELQDHVVENVAGALEPTLIWAEAARARAKPTESLEAYDLCLRASPLVYRQNSLAMLEEGLALLKQALELDNSYIVAKALTCMAHTGALAARWWTFEQAQAALPLANEVLDSNTDDPFAMAVAGHYIAYIGHQHQRGLTALQQARIMNPNSAFVAMYLGWVYNYVGENEAALEQLRRVQRISPLHPQIGIATCGIGHALMQSGDLAGAVSYFERAITEYPEFATTQLNLIGCYWGLGRHEDSARMAEWYRAKVPDMTISRFLRTSPHQSKDYRRLMVSGFEAQGFPA